MEHSQSLEQVKSPQNTAATALAAVSGALPTAPNKHRLSTRLTRFQIQEFVNPRTGTKSWRVHGIKRDGERVRKNFLSLEAARSEQINLETEYLQGRTETAIRATKLSAEQLQLAEVAFLKLGDDWPKLLDAVEHWNRQGKQMSVSESPRIDDAWQQFAAWLDNGCKLRDLSRKNLKQRVNMFVTQSRTSRFQMFCRRPLKNSWTGERTFPRKLRTMTVAPFPDSFLGASKGQGAGRQ